MNLPLPALAGPAAATPLRRAGSIRRTSHLLMSYAGGVGSDVHITGRARDLVTTAAGEPVVVGEVAMDVVIGGEREVRSASLDPAHPTVGSLAGARGGKGFRQAIDAAIPGERERGSLSYFLLDDLAGCSLIAGFAWLRRPGARLITSEQSIERAALVAGICSGYRPGSSSMLIRQRGEMPVQDVAFTTPLDDLGDPHAWHVIHDPNGAVAMMRRRRVDVWCEGVEVVVDAMFRDNTWEPEPDGRETVVHEYELSARVDGSGRLASVRATPRALPYAECPLAAAEVERCVGLPTTQLRGEVLRMLRGIDSCTHLNDAMRALAEVPVLANELIGRR